MKFTMFRSTADPEKIDYDLPWSEIVQRAGNPREYPSKDDMPLLKLARFGEHRSERGFLRNEDNMLAITGVEGDYDGEQLPLEDALTTLGMAELRVLLYTTPSHTPERPRWRVLAPCSVELPAGRREALMGRLNGVLGGVLGGESFVRAQGYFWGRMAGAVYRVGGSGQDLPCINERADLDAGAIMPAVRDPPPNAVALHVSPLGEGERNRGLFVLASALRRRNMSPEAIMAALLVENQARCRPPLPDAEVRTLARSGAHYTPSVDYAPPEHQRVERTEIVPTGTLIPRSVLTAQEVRLATLDDLPVSKSQNSNVVHPSIGNANTIIRATLNGRLWTDASTGLPMNGVRLLSEVDSFYETAQINNLPGGHTFRPQTVMQAMTLLARGNPIDPWCDWLDDLVWDGVERLNSMGEDYFGVTVGEDQLERIIFRKLMVGVVARQFSPGCKFDLMIVLEGAQGTRKSTALRTLFGNPYVASWEHDFNTKDFRQQLQGHVCVEIAELASFARSDMQAIKSILSETTDTYRASYARFVERRPRRCVFVGTSNDNSYLTDAEGNRRFVPVKCGPIEVDGLHANRDQLFAEAVVAYRAGGADARWWDLPGRVVEEQADRMVVDPWRDIIAEHLLAAVVREIRVGELLSGPLNLLPRDQNSGTQKRVGAILRQLGYAKAKSNGRMIWRLPGP